MSGVVGNSAGVGAARCQVWCEVLRLARQEMLRRLVREDMTTAAATAAVINCLIHIQQTGAARCSSTAHSAAISCCRISTGCRLLTTLLPACRVTD